MSTAVATIGLTYRGTDIQILDGIFLEIVRGLTEVVEVRGVDLIVPAYAGQIVRNRVGHRLAIELRGWVRGTGASETPQREDIAAQRAAFRALFDPRLDPGDLVATLEDGTQQTIVARTLNILSVEIVPTFYQVSVELESVAPDWS
jgi:hypothetical protein